MSLDDIGTIHLVRTTDDAFECLRWLSLQNDIAIDTEGTGLSPEKDRVRLVQVGNDKEAWAIPFEINQMLVEDIVKRYEGIYTTHNGPYDWHMLASHGIKLPRRMIHDTRLMAHTLSSTGPLGLKQLYSTHVDPRGADLQDDLKKLFRETGWNWETVPWDHPTYWQYACVDTCETRQLKDRLLPQVNAISPDSYALELAASWPISDMERHGILLDRPYFEGLAGKAQQQVDMMIGEIKAEWGISPGSVAQLSEKLQAEGVRLTKLTAGGNSYSMDKYVLDRIRHPLAQAVIAYREQKTLLSTYLLKYLELTEHGSRIHPSINSVGGRSKNPFEPGGAGQGVRTGRMSSDNPNIQNVPTRSELGKVIRNGFIVEEDHVWMSSDFDQIEMRGMAHASDDPDLKAMFLTGEDFFVSMAKKMFNDPDFVKEDPRRSRVKNGMYAKVYGAGPDKFALTAKMIDADGNPLIAEATAFIRHLDTTFPGPARFAQAVINKGYQRLRDEGVAYVTSPLTGRRMIADRDRVFALVNYYVQGMAGEVMKMKIIEADQAGLTKYMQFPVHDELDLSVPKDEVPEVRAALHEIMNDDKLLSVPVSASVDIGSSWGEAKG